jgi:tetratricopeptide (TPR) repeat protein
MRMSGLRASPLPIGACVIGLLCVAAQGETRSTGLEGAPAVSFEEAARRASASRESDAGQAIRWYREAVRLRPAWDEGWWYLGALSYERGDPAETARAFTRFVRLKPDSGPGWALLGLAEFQRQRYDAALADLAHGLAQGSVGNAEIRDEVYYHVAVLRIRAGQFELAMEPLEALARANADSPRLVTPCGLALLRLPALPGAVPEEQRELVRAAGSAAVAALALRDTAGPLFEDLLRKHPTTPSLHYGYGAYLLRKDEGNAAAAIRQFEEEIRVDPKAVYARLEIAYAHLKDGQAALALPYAEQAVALAPGLFAAHNALGRALFETGRTQQGIAEMEKAVQLAPDSERARATLAGAYARAGRPQDADRERDAVRMLKARRGTARPSSLVREDAQASGEAKP